MSMAEALLVRDVVVRHPKTLPVDAAVAEVREQFTDDHVHMVLLVDTTGRLMCALERADLGDGHPAGHLPGGPATADGNVVLDDTPLTDARRLLDATAGRRLAVVDRDGRLVGLLCLKRDRSGYCSDGDVAARQRERDVLRSGVDRRPRSVEACS